MPGRGEEMLRDIPEKVKALIKEYIKGLLILGHIIRW
jgi:hypothetical protein